MILPNIDITLLAECKVDVNRQYYLTKGIEELVKYIMLLALIN